MDLEEFIPVLSLIFILGIGIWRLISLAQSVSQPITYTVFQNQTKTGACTQKPITVVIRKPITRVPYTLVVPPPSGK